MRGQAVASHDAVRCARVLHASPGCFTDGVRLCAPRTAWHLSLRRWSVRDAHRLTAEGRARLRPGQVERAAGLATGRIEICRRVASRSPPNRAERPNCERGAGMANGKTYGSHASEPGVLPRAPHAEQGAVICNSAEGVTAAGATQYRWDDLQGWAFEKSSLF